MDNFTFDRDQPDDRDRDDGRRRDRDDDRGRDDRRRDDSEGDDGPQKAFPTIVMMAGLVWIAVGCLSLLNMLATFAMQGAAGGGGPGSNPCAGVCAGMIGIAFLVCGYQTVTGTAKDTIGNSIGSIALGMLQMLAAAAIGFGGALAGPNGGRGAPPPQALLIVAVVVGLFGAGLILAGLLGIAGRSDYLEWREIHHPKPRKRPRRVERDDRDDRYER